MSTVDWERIKAEYITGGVSLRKLADKYGVQIDTIKKRSAREKWNEERTKIAPKLHQKTVQETVQRIADVNADNADIAARIRTKLLRRIEREIDALPDTMGTESKMESCVRAGDGQMKRSTRAYKLRDLTAAYLDLTRYAPETVNTGDFSALDEVDYGE